MDVLIGDERSQGRRQFRLPLPKWMSSLVTYGLIAATSIWTFGYVSGLFPYLGYETRSERTFTGFTVESRANPKFGTNVFFLIKGQTAFYDYQVDSTERGGIVLDIAPYYHIGLTDDARFIKGPAKGRVEFVVPSTGVYKFFHDFSINGINNQTSYAVSWGAY